MTWVKKQKQPLHFNVTDLSGTVHPARSLSDGTLRFLALAVIEQDPTSHGLLCLEKPENGIHPKRIPAMLRLLEDIAVDVNTHVGPDNPLRQIIVNTHSPVVVDQVQDDSLLVAELKEIVRKGERFKGARFSWLPDTWRAGAEPETYPVARGKVLDYLRYVTDFSDRLTHPVYETGKRKSVRIGKRADLQPRLLSVNE